MPKKAREITAKELRDLKTPGVYSVGGVDGLKVVVTVNRAKCWILRAKVGERTGEDGKVRPIRREIGLGGFPDVTLAQARERAREEKENIRQGIDTVEKRKAAKLALTRAAQARVTFQDVARQCYAVKADEFRNQKHAAQWYGSLETYAFPSIGRMSINDITTRDVLAVLEPIWKGKTETANRLRQRMASVFKFAMSGDHPLRNSPVNPAEWDHLKEKLPNPEKLKKRKGRRHHAALPVAEVPRLMADLSGRESISAKALMFTILTAARSGEVRGATWDEIDLDARVWRLSADRMKADKPHTVPLSDAAVAILDSLPKGSPKGLIFPATKGGSLSDMALSKLLKDVHAADVARGGAGYVDPIQNRVATPHGTARSSFKDWARQNGRFPDEWSELALAHINSDETRAAYARNELLEERRGMMEVWGQHCQPSQAGGRVVAFERG